MLSFSTKRRPKVSSAIISVSAAAAAAKSPQSCPTLCDPIDSSPPGSPVPGILQARTLEWVDISFSNAWKSKVKVKSLSHVQLSATPWIEAHQDPPSMGFSRQEYWSGVPLPSPIDQYSCHHIEHVYDLRKFTSVSSQTNSSHSPDFYHHNQLVLPVPELNKNGIIQYVLFCVTSFAQ